MIAIQVNPGLALLAGALAALLAPLSWRSTIALVASLAALSLAFTTSFGEHASFAQIGLKLVALRLDALSQTFGVLFSLVSIMLALHGADPRAKAETGVLLLLAGGAVTAVYSGDFISFVASAELCTMAAVALLLLREEGESQEIGMRLLGWQALSGMLFLSGAAFSIVESGGADFARLSPGQAGGALILAAFGVKAGFPIAHVWFKEAAARASDAGSAAIIGFTTMLGVYGLMRAYAGEPALIAIGLVMAFAPAVYAMAEDDLRRALAYGFITQTGIIVTAIGIGSPLALSGAAALAFSTVLAFVLLAMALGAVREITGACNASELGGLARSMPVVTILSVIAALCIAGAPATVGYASLALVLEAAAKSGTPYLHLAIIAAFAACVVHTAAKIPYAVFFGAPRRPLPPQGLFGSRHLAMLFAAALIVMVGAAPRWLYAYLPSDPTHFSAYDPARIVRQLEITFFAGLAAAAARVLRLYPGEQPGPLRDVDWLIHGPLWRVLQVVGGAFGSLRRRWRDGEGAAARWTALLVARTLLQPERAARALAAPQGWLLYVVAVGLFLAFGYVAIRA